MKPYAIICYGHKLGPAVSIDGVSRVEIGPAWSSWHSHDARIIVTDGDIVTFAQGSQEFCEQCKTEMEAMLKQRRTFYWNFRKEDEKHE